MIKEITITVLSPVDCTDEQFQAWENLKINGIINFITN